MARTKDPLEDATPTEATDIVASGPMAYINREAKGLDYVPDNFEEAMELAAQAAGGQVIEVSGSPYTLVDKSELVGIPFVITDVRAYEGKYGDTVAVMIVTKEPVKGSVKLVFNDGSTGIMPQLKGMIQETGLKTFHVPNGLRASEYDTTIEDPFDGPKTVHGVTYYLA